MIERAPTCKLLTSVFRMALVLVQWFGLGLTLVDSLDLLWLINEKQEFYDAAQWVTDELDPSVASDVNVFEVTIRVMGGMLSAYHYSKEDVFLRKAS